MTTFTPYTSLMGGILIGLSGALLLLAAGRIAGISGIISGALAPPDGDWAWRLAFLAGLVGASVLLFNAGPAAFTSNEPTSTVGLIAAGLLVGVGTRLGSGCTSGHGVCGIGRFSRRSIIATVTFITTGVLAVWLRGMMTGGAS